MKKEKHTIPQSQLLCPCLVVFFTVDWFQTGETETLCSARTLLLCSPNNWITVMTPPFNWDKKQHLLKSGFLSSFSVIYADLHEMRWLRMWCFVRIHRKSWNSVKSYWELNNFLQPLELVPRTLFLICLSLTLILYFASEVMFCEFGESLRTI